MEARKVLIVDDHRDNRELLAVYLEQSGYAVLTAADGREGVNLARDSRPDLILMDISMPGLDGFAAIELLRADPATADIPVVALSAYDASQYQARAREVGVSAYLTKPVSPRQLLSDIERWLSERPSPGAPTPSRAPALPPSAQERKPRRAHDLTS